MRPIWLDADRGSVRVIDQRRLPHELVIAELTDVDDAIAAIRQMVVRGAPLIGATGAYGVYLAVARDLSANDANLRLRRSCKRIKSARPTAVNLSWAVDRVQAAVLQARDAGDRLEVARRTADAIVREEVTRCRRIGEHGLGLIEAVARRKSGAPVQVLTHCNAGWLACIEYGTATAPIYLAHDRGIDVHVWVDETRPLNQGARLTAWELGKYGVKHTIVTDNAGGHLMQHGLVDMVIVGTDRTTATGDVANKIGTYLKALAARDNGVPFYVALPSSTIDWNMQNGFGEIPIEERNADEVRYVSGLHRGKITRVLVCPPSSPAANFAFDVTPARLITGLITERGVCRPNAAELSRLFPEKDCLSTSGGKPRC